MTYSSAGELQNSCLEAAGSEQPVPAGRHRRMTGRRAAFLSTSGSFTLSPGGGNGGSGTPRV
jgi:hypothetical protein